MLCGNKTNFESKNMFKNIKKTTKTKNQADFKNSKAATPDIIMRHKQNTNNPHTPFSK